VVLEWLLLFVEFEALVMRSTSVVFGEFISFSVEFASGGMVEELNEFVELTSVAFARVSLDEVSFRLPSVELASVAFTRVSLDEVSFRLPSVELASVAFAKLSLVEVSFTEVVLLSVSSPVEVVLS